jgi:hypothetical protein
MRTKPPHSAIKEWFRPDQLSSAQAGFATGPWRKQKFGDRGTKSKPIPAPHLKAD